MSYKCMDLCSPIRACAPTMRSAASSPEQIGHRGENTRCRRSGEAQHPVPDAQRMIVTGRGRSEYRISGEDPLIVGADENAWATVGHDLRPGVDDGGSEARGV